MQAITLIEFGRFSRSQVPPRLLRRLQAFDEHHARATGQKVFDWDHLHHVAARSHVGVIQIAGIQVQILPKIDSMPNQNDDAYSDGGHLQRLSQSNLLYMLSLTRKIPILPRELALLRLERMPLLEAMIRVFAQRLVEELRRGLDHAYVYREENGCFFRGKLLVSRHIRHNVALNHRCYVGFEEFIADTWLSRILKAACSRLLGISRWVTTQQRLREALLLLADVEDRRIRGHDFQRIQFNRNTERFEPLLDFARMTLFGQSPAPAAGGRTSFSLLFPMEKLFEEFIARFVQRHSREMGLERSRIHVQALNRRRWLVMAEGGDGRFRLKPDIVIDAPEGRPELIVDTKWKRPKSDYEDARNGVTQADLYQLYAYAHRYESPDNLLLYPQVQGVSPKHYRMAADQRTRLRTGYIDINVDLVRDRARLVAQLCQLLNSPSGAGAAEPTYPG